MLVSLFWIARTLKGRSSTAWRALMFIVTDYLNQPANVTG